MNFSPTWLHFSHTLLCSYNWCSWRSSSNICEKSAPSRRHPINPFRESRPTPLRNGRQGSRYLMPLRSRKTGLLVFKIYIGCISLKRSRSPFLWMKRVRRLFWWDICFQVVDGLETFIPIYMNGPAEAALIFLSCHSIQMSPFIMGTLTTARRYGVGGMGRVYPFGYTL